MIVLQTTYARLIYQTVLNPPDSCVREVTGTVNYMVMGWSVNYESIGFLIPMTLVILASLVVLIMALRVHAKSGGNAKSGGGGFDPLKPNALILLAAVHHDDEEEKEVPSQLSEWEHIVKFRTEVCAFQRMMGLITETIWPSQLLQKEVSKFAGDYLAKLKSEIGRVFSGEICGES